MNKSFRSVLLIAALVVLGGAAARAAESRLATVDLVKVFNEYWKTKQSKLALDDSKNEVKAELDKMQDAHKKLVQQYQKLLADANDQAVSGEEREKRKKALEPRLKELRESDDSLKQYFSRNETDLKMKTDRMMEAVIKDIKAVVAGKARTGGYTLVLDLSAKSMTQTDVILYNSGEADLTKAVIEELNLTAPPDAGVK